MFVEFVGLGATVPLMPVHVRKHLGVNDFQAGLLLGVLWASSLSSRLVAGPHTDRHGRRSSLIIGCACCLVAGLLYLTTNPWIFGFGRILHGAAEAFILTAAAAAVVDLAPKGRSSKGLGYLSSAVWGGLALGPAVAAQAGSFHAVAIAIAATSAVALAMVFALPHDKPHDSHAAQRLQLGLVMRPGAVLGLANIGQLVLMGYLPLHLATRGGGSEMAFTGFSVTVLLSRVVLGSLPDRFGPRATLLTGLSILAGALVILIYSPNPWVSLAGAVLAALGYSFPWPSLALIVISRVPSNKRGSGLAALTAYYDIFVACGSVLLGGIAQRAGIVPVFWAAIAAVLTGIVVGFNLRPDPSHPIEPGDPEAAAEAEEVAAH